MVSVRVEEKFRYVVGPNFYEKWVNNFKFTGNLNKMKNGKKFLISFLGFLCTVIVYIRLV